MKPAKKYYFSVEGETEQWYLQWLQSKINESSKATSKVSFNCKIEQNPLKRVKSLVVTGKTEIHHISDYESNDTIHVKEFQNTLDNLGKAEKIGKQITYKLGYTNFTFDLWVILHKVMCNNALTHRRQYIVPINKAFNEKFESMDDYKKESNFKGLLDQLTLDDVINAVERAKSIQKTNREKGYSLCEYKGYKYYKENPSLGIWEVIDAIIRDCELVMC